jgi:hypothetical protein
VTALEPYWRAMARGQTGAHAEQRTAAQVSQLLTLARRHLQRNGVLSAPPFAQPQRGERSEPAALLGIDIQQVADAAGPFADRPAVVPLASVEQQPMLSRDPGAAVWLHFAPAALRGAIQEAAGNAPVRDGVEVWTSSGRYAGLLRLTPLNPHALRTVRQRERDADGGEEYSRW